MSIDVDEENYDIDDLVEDGDEKTTLAKAGASSSSGPKFGFPPDDFLASPNMLKHELPTFEIGVVALLATASLE